MKNLETTNSEQENIIDKEFYEVIMENKRIYAYTTFERAFPYYKDGLKYVIRCILYEMINEGYTKSTVKSATIVGGIIGQWSPHGDQSTYQAAAGLIPFHTNNYPLITGQGAYATIINKDIAHYRYTEMRLSDFANDIIDDINVHTINHLPNFDNRLEMPEYIPFKIPILLLNSSYGIGEAFVQSIPLHNLSDIVDICIKYINDPNIPNEILVDGFYPDFPNYGIITNKSEIERYYKYGEKASIKMKSTVDIDRDNHRIYIRDLPYNVNRDSIIDTIRKRNAEKHVIMSKIHDLLDIKTKRDGEIHYEFEIIYEKNSNLLEIVNELTKQCLTTSYPLNFMLYYGDHVKHVTIKDIVSEWYKVRYATIRRKINYKLISRQNRVHILEGILIIYDHIDEVINFVKTAKNKEDIIKFLVKRFDKMSEIQAKSISEMALYKLSRTSKDDLKHQIKELRDQISEFEQDLFRINEIIIEELLYIKNKYQRPRRTQLIDEDSESKQMNNIVMSSGAILHSHNQYTIFDLQNLVNGKTILNGLKSVKIDGKNVKDIVGIREIRDTMIGIFTIYKNGTARKIEPQEIGYINNWINHPISNENYIKYMLPIYTENDLIVELTEDLKLKITNPNIFTKNQSNHNQIIACECIRTGDDAVLICDENDNFVSYYLDDIPEIQSKSGNGVKTAFENIDTKYIMKTFNSHSEKKFIFTVMDTENNIYMISKDFMDIRISSRPSKTRNILQIDSDEYKIIDINIINTSKKNTKCLLIGNGSSSSLKINNFKGLAEMKKINTATKCIIQFSDE